MITLLQSFTNTAKEYRASTAPVVSQYYANVWHSIDKQYWRYFSITTDTVLRQL